MEQKKRKILSIAICLLLLFVTATSFFYIAKEEEHACTGADCPICACVHQAEQNIRSLGTGMALPVCTGIVMLLAALLSVGCVHDLPYVSLVSQKVRLND